VFETKKFVPVVEGTGVNVPKAPGGGGVDVVVPNAIGVPLRVEVSTVEEDFIDTEGVLVKPK